MWLNVVSNKSQWFIKLYQYKSITSRRIKTNHNCTLLSFFGSVQQPSFLRYTSTQSLGTFTQNQHSLQTTKAKTAGVVLATGSFFLVQWNNCSNNDCFIRNISTTSTAAAAAVTVSNSNFIPPVPKLKIPSRQEQIQKLQEASSRTNPGTHFDVLVIGGGVTGCGVALDATMRGLNTAMIERYDFGCETSSRSTKLIWAGIRYLGTAIAGLLRFQNVTRPIAAIKDFLGEFHLVQVASNERKILLQNNPHLTNWVPIAIPIRNWLSWPPPMGHPLFALAPITLPMVMKFYDSLSGFTCPPSHIMTIARSERKFPQLDTTPDKDIKYFQIFYEGQHNDSRTNTCLALTAAEEGATIANYIEMIDIITDPNTGKAIGIKCRNNLSSTNETFDVYSKSIIFCGGPFTDELRKMEFTSSDKSGTSTNVESTAEVKTMKNEFVPAVAAAAGTHIVLPGYYSPGGIGMLDINTSDGRFLFFLPWEGSTLVGTTDRKGAPVSDHGPPEKEIEWLLKEVQRYLSDDVKVRRQDVLSAWQGFRPLASDPNAVPGAPISRDHIISTNPVTGITFIAGGKWTTYREMAEDVLDKVIELHGLQPLRPCQTKYRTLRGGIGYHRNVPIRLVQDLGVSETSSKHLARTYGMHAYDVCALNTIDETRAAKTNSDQKPTWTHFGKTLVEGYPYLECEVIYACRYEMACTVSDMLTLRTRLAYLNKEAALLAAPRVAEIMAHELQWTVQEKDKQLQAAIELINTFGGRVINERPEDTPLALAKNQDDTFKLSHDKLGQGSASRGAGFG
jgi:glycerol-3-phosphate dehydrogenase